MQRLVSQWSYWLGLLCVAIALVMRALNAIGYLIPVKVVQGVTIWYMSFYKGALLFLLVAIAAPNYESLKRRTP